MSNMSIDSLKNVAVRYYDGIYSDIEKYTDHDLGDFLDAFRKVRYRMEYPDIMPTIRNALDNQWPMPLGPNTVQLVECYDDINIFELNKSYFNSFHEDTPLNEVLTDDYMRDAYYAYKPEVAHLDYSIVKQNRYFNPVIAVCFKEAIHHIKDEDNFIFMSYISLNDNLKASIPPTIFSLPKDKRIAFLNDYFMKQINLKHSYYQEEYAEEMKEISHFSPKHKNHTEDNLNSTILFAFSMSTSRAFELALGGKLRTCSNIEEIF